MNIPDFRDRIEFATNYGKFSSTVLWPKNSNSGENSEKLAEEGSAINNGSIAISSDLAGVSIFTAGDLEPAPQSTLLQSGALRHVAVLKMFHHGSKFQDFAAIKRLSPSPSVALGAGTHTDIPRAKPL